MTTAEWATLVPAVISLIGAATAYLKARTAHNLAQTHVMWHGQQNDNQP